MAIAIPQSGLRRYKGGQGLKISVKVDEPYALQFWTREFNTSEQVLKDAVSIVGPRFGNVRRYLQKLEAPKRLS